ncbi:tigger transposable element-derived protein 1 isoform X1 [Megalopta genalis]|uniref:tigger transposable element-derived protein 1 isoform X1 n=1 Tax=Megalopta genalis TaxID=115081 RepID=UPI003FD1FD13
MSTSKKQRMLYTNESINLAVKAVKSGMPINAASRKYQIPRSTLHSKVIGLYDNKKPGPVSILPPNQESLLVEWIFECSCRGHPVTKMQLLNSVRILVKEMGIKTPFGENGPGKSWYSGFLKRHEDVCTQMTENLTHARAAVSEGALKKWFSTVEAHLKEKGLLNIDPSRIFSTDETSLSLDPKSDKVLKKKGSKNVYSINEKEALTVLVTGNAAGQLAPPLVIFSSKHIPKEMYEKMPSGWIYGTSDSGWMQGEHFYEYVTNVFYPWIISTNISLPVILYVDGHVSHLTQPLAKFCVANRIELIALHPNSTHIIQPMDQSMFCPMKAAWTRQANEYRQQNNCSSVSKIDAAQQLKRVFDNLDLERILSNGFKACGLMPFSSNAINYSKIFQRTNTPNQLSEQPNDRLNVDERNLDYITTLKRIEENINPATLTVFQAMGNTNEWTGRTEDTSLFYVWNNISKLIEGESTQQICPTTKAEKHDVGNSQLDENGSNSMVVLEEVMIKEEKDTE